MAEVEVVEPGVEQMIDQESRSEFNRLVTSLNVRGVVLIKLNTSKERAEVRKVCHGFSW